jgi:hypothetical protein
MATRHCPHLHRAVGEDEPDFRHTSHEEPNHHHPDVLRHLPFSPIDAALDVFRQKMCTALDEWQAARCPHRLAPRNVNNSTKMLQRK